MGQNAPNWYVPAFDDKATEVFQAKGNLLRGTFSTPIKKEASQVTFFVKSKLAGSTGSAQSRIDNFVKSVAPSGRSLLEKRGELTLTIINPDQYRDQIVQLVAKEALKNASFFGPSYAVNISGIDQQFRNLVNGGVRRIAASPQEAWERPLRPKSAAPLPVHL